MIPKIFGATASDFSVNGIGALLNTISCEVKEEINGAYELNATILADDPRISYVKVGNIITAKPNMTDPVQAFVIESVEKNIDGEVTVYATHIAQHRTKLIPVSPFTAVSLTNTLSLINTNSLETNPFTFKSTRSVSTQFSFNVPKTVRQLMGGEEGSILDVYRGEYRFDNFTIELVTKRGRDSGVQIMYGKNMTDYKSGEGFGWSETITGVIPYWTDEETTVIGDIQYSSLADKFDYHKTIVKDCSDRYEEAPTVAELNSYALSWINSKGNPSLTLSVGFDQYGLTDSQVNALELGDTVHVLNSLYQTSYESRIVSITFDALAEKYTELQIGSLTANLNDAVNSIVDTASASSSGKLDKSGGTMTGQLKTSYRESVAMGSYGSSQTTVDGLVNEVRFSSGAMGSASINTAYTKDGTTIPTGWYNFIFSPHRSGGVNGSASGDNCNYGTLILAPMTFTGDSFIIRCSSSGAASVRRVGFTNKATFDGNASGVTGFWNSSITTHQDGYLEREGNVVYCYMRFSAPSSVTSGQQIATIPVGYRPSHVCHYTATRAWALQATAPISVSKTSGAVAFINTAFAASANYVLCATWLTEESFPS